MKPYQGQKPAQPHEGSVPSTHPHTDSGKEGRRGGVVTEGRREGGLFTNKLARQGGGGGEDTARHVYI